MTNYLWLISQSENNGYDTYDSAVVVAPTEEAAKRIHPSEYGKGWSDETGSWYGERDGGERYPFDNSFPCWSVPSRVEARRLGVADTELTPGTVVCASFNAG